MKKHLSLLVILLTTVFCFNTNSALGYSFIKVTKNTEDEDGGIVDGGYYLITSYKSSKYNFFIYQSRSNGEHYFSSTFVGSGIYNGTFDEAVNISNIVKIIKQSDGTWAIYDVKLKKYWNITNDNNNYVSFFDNQKDAGKISFAIDKKYGLCIQITNSNDAVYNLAFDSSKEFEWYRTLDNSNHYNIDLYRITNYITSLDETQDISTTTDKTNVSLNVTFVNDKYNTLMLPCAISGSYKAVFGTDVTVYSVTSIGTDGITFSPVTDGNGLSANTPYLLKGTFFTPPYIINNTTISTTGVNDGIMSVANGSNTFNGVYATGKDLGNSEAYILYMGKFYSCSSYSSMPIKLFRWYYKGATQQAKQLIISNTPTGINVPESIAQEHSDSRIFRLDGTYAGTSFDVLPKGFYINNGKKIVKQ